VSGPTFETVIEYVEVPPSTTRAACAAAATVTSAEYAFTTKVEVRCNGGCPPDIVTVEVLATAPLVPAATASELRNVRLEAAGRLPILMADPAVGGQLALPELVHEIAPCARPVPSRVVSTTPDAAWDPVFATLMSTLAVLPPGTTPVGPVATIEISGAPVGATGGGLPSPPPPPQPGNSKPSESKASVRPSHVPYADADIVASPCPTAPLTGGVNHGCQMSQVDQTGIDLSSTLTADPGLRRAGLLEVGEKRGVLKNVKRPDRRTRRSA